jgi:hypothetical protein
MIAEFLIVYAAILAAELTILVMSGWWNARRERGR